jgi:uncharacterized membrane protein YcaP (DUF421 family)
VGAPPERVGPAKPDDEEAREMDSWFGSDWEGLGYVALTTVAMYATMVVSVRVAGRRTIAQLAAYDVVVTVALGTLLASTIVSADPSYARATVATVVLLALQVALGALRRRSDRFDRALTFEPEVVVEEGRLQLPTGLATSQLTEGELRARLRQQGVFELDGVAVVVLEPSGGLSVSAERPAEQPG